MATPDERDVRALLNRLEAQDVIVRYAACLDDRDFAAYRDCFAPDVELPGFAAEVIRGPDAWIDFVRRVLEPYASTQHLLGPPSIEIREGRAQLRTPLQARHFFREPRGRIFTLWGTYRTALVRRDDAWKIHRHTLETHAVRTDDAYRR